MRVQRGRVEHANRIADHPRALQRGARPDHPDTTNDESNDQPRGHFGTRTLLVMNVNIGNSYPLDADVEDGELTRLYLPNGGCVDSVGCELDEDLTGLCLDERGRSWDIQGEQ